MTVNRFYNDDPRYELMAEIINGALLPEADGIKDDLIEILRLCYTFTVQDKWSATDLAEQIVAYLQGQWSTGGGEFYKFAEDFWTPTTEEPTLRRPADVTEVLIDLEN